MFLFINFRTSGNFSLIQLRRRKKNLDRDGKTGGFVFFLVRVRRFFFVLPLDFERKLEIKCDRNRAWESAFLMVQDGDDYDDQVCEFRTANRQMSND